MYDFCTRFSEAAACTRSAAHVLVVGGGVVGVELAVGGDGRQ